MIAYVVNSYWDKGRKASCSIFTSTLINDLKNFSLSNRKCGNQSGLELLRFTTSGFGYSGASLVGLYRMVVTY